MSKRNKSGLTKPQLDLQNAIPIIQKFELYRNGQRNGWALEAAKDKEFVNNVQWKVEDATALENANQPVVVNNEIKPARDQVVGQLTDHDPRWLAAPRENSDASMAGKISDLASYIWDKSKGNMHFRKAVEDFEDTGLFVLHTYYDPEGDMGKGEIRICRIPTDDIYLDPRTNWRNAQNSEDIFLGTILSEEEVRSRYIDYDFTNSIPYDYDMRTYGSGSIQEGQVFKPDFIMSQNKHYYRVIDKYTRIKAKMFWIYDPNSDYETVLDKMQYVQFGDKPAIIAVRQGSEQTITKEVDIRKYMAIMQQYGTTFFQYSDGSIAAGYETNRPSVNQQGQVIHPIPGSTTQLRIVTMGDLLREGKIKWQIVRVDRIKRQMVIGEKLYKSVIMPISDYPFGITMLHHTDTPFCYGDARITRPIQEQINKISSIIISYNMNITSVRAFIEKNSMDKEQIKERWGKAGFELFEYQSELGAAPIIVQLTQMSNAFYLQLDRLKMLILRIYGAYPEQEGQMSAPPQTLGGTMLLDEAGLRRSASKLKLIESALNDLGGVIAEMIPFVYSERKLVRILLPNGATRDANFNQQVQEGEVTTIKNDLTVNRYDLIMQSGSTLPSNRAARFNALLKMWELKAIKDPTPLLRETDLPDVDEIIKNESLINQAEQTIMQLQQTIKTLGGNLQTKTREKVHADEKAMLAKTKSDLDSLVAKANAAVLLGQQRTNDVVKDFKAKVNDILNNINNNNGGTSKPDGNASEPQGEQNDRS